MIKTIRNHVPLVLICIFLFLFAPSNVVTYNDKIITTVPLPNGLLDLCGIFRASSRMFYPVYYLILIGGEYFLWTFKKHLAKTKIYGILILVVYVQLFDLKACVYQKHADMLESTLSTNIFDDEILQAAADGSKVLLADEMAVDIRRTVVWALKNDMACYPTVANSGTYEKSAEFTSANLARIKSSGDIGDFVIVITNLEILEKYNSFPQIAFYQYDNIYYIFKSGTGGYDKKVLPIIE